MAANVKHMLLKNTVLNETSTSERLLVTAENAVVTAGMMI